MTIGWALGIMSVWLGTVGGQPLNFSDGIASNQVYKLASIRLMASSTLARLLKAEILK